MYPNGAHFAVQLSFDLEMCTNFPYWSSFWNYRKGAIDAGTKDYVRKINDTCRKYGAKAHYFLVGSLFEDPDVSYLEETVAGGHAVGNHTYTHIRLKATETAQLAGIHDAYPWLAGRRTALEVIRDEIAATTAAMRSRLGVAPKGLRSPGGFTNGLQDAPAVQALLQDEGFWWVSTHYNDTIQRSAALDRVCPLDQDLLVQAFTDSETALQPYRYRSGLIEIPLAGITDVVAWRSYRPGLRTWLDTLVAAVDHAYDNGLILLLTSHPAVLASIDPHCQIVDTVLNHATKKDARVWLPDLEEVASYCQDKVDLRTE